MKVILRCQILANFGNQIEALGRFRLVI